MGWGGGFLSREEEEGRSGTWEEVKGIWRTSTDPTEWGGRAGSCRPSHMSSLKMVVLHDIPDMFTCRSYHLVL